MGQSLNPSNVSQGPTDSCLLIVRSPADSVVYGCFRAIAKKWRSSLLVEGLTIEGDVPISSGFLLDSPPSTISKLLEADVQIISRISLEFAGLSVSYRRTGGHGPHMYRQSYFDEILIRRGDGCSMSAEDIKEIIGELQHCLGVGSCMASGDLAFIANDLNVSASSMPPKPLLV